MLQGWIHSHSAWHATISNFLLTCRLTQHCESIRFAVSLKWHRMYLIHQLLTRRCYPCGSGAHSPFHKSHKQISSVYSNNNMRRNVSKMPGWNAQPSSSARFAYENEEREAKRERETEKRVQFTCKSRWLDGWWQPLALDDVENGSAIRIADNGSHGKEPRLFNRNLTISTPN